MTLEGSWDQLGIEELPEHKAPGASASGESGGSTDHEMYAFDFG